LPLTGGGPAVIAISITRVGPAARGEQAGPG